MPQRTLKSQGWPPGRFPAGRRADMMADMDHEDMQDMRDGLTRLERVILVKLSELQDELGGRSAPTLMLYGRVVEVIDVSKAEFQWALRRLMGSG